VRMWWGGAWSAFGLWCHSKAGTIAMCPDEHLHIGMVATVTLLQYYLDQISEVLPQLLTGTSAAHTSREATAT
jgi:hypothetical protein